MNNGIIGYVFFNLPEICIEIYGLNAKIPGICLRILHIEWLLVKVKQDWLRFG